MKKLYAAIFIACFAFPASVNAAEIIPFEKIMNLMNGADIRYERVGHYNNIPFKVFKKNTLGNCRIRRTTLEER